jgi:alpha-mannosidase
VQIRDIRSTDLFAGTPGRPLQILRVTLAGPADQVRVRAEGPGVTTPDPPLVAGVDQGAEREVDLAVAIAAPYTEGTPRRVTVIAEPAAGESVRAEGTLVAAEPGWTMYMVSHFHYDPVWWNTQSGYAATWDDLPAVAQERRQPFQEPAFRLVRAHLDAALKDPDYKFVLAELDYLRPYWDACPEDRAALRQLIADGRVELVGGMYNEPNTNLTSLESTIRNVIYGVGYQRDVIGGDPRTGWMLDVFGHDPAYPSVMADAGLTSSSWARGPFHQWGPKRTVGTNEGMQFPSEFEWIGPDGRGLLTSYMANHYSAGWKFNNLPGLAEAEEEAYRQFQDLKPVALTRNVLLPVGADHVLPSRWATEIHRDWNKRYVWPRFICGLPAEFFAAVRSEAGRRGRAAPPQSRDMNPLYTGKDVSYIDTKQGQRAAEVALFDAEKLATLATLLPSGAPAFPHAAIDKAWRLLCFGAHHDGITGSESDQVYLDLLGGWREAWELARGVRDAAIGCIADRIDTRGEGDALVVVNTLSRPRTDMVSVAAPDGAAVVDDAGRVVPSVTGGGSLTFRAEDVPATGYRTYRLAGPDGVAGADSVADAARPAGAAEPAGWHAIDGHRAENDAFLVEADPARGGTLTRILDKRSGRDLLRPGTVGNELVCHDEYPEHPDFKEGPWHLIPTGTRQGASSVPATVRAEASPAGQRLVTSCRLGELTFTQEVIAWHGLDRLEFRTHVDGSIGHDRLLRVRFPLDVGGARPVYEVGNAVIGRSFGFPDVDSAKHPWTQDNPAYNWAGLSAAVRVALRGPSGGRLHQAIGVAEIIAPEGTAGLRDLVSALAARGVTATTSRPDGPRYGSLHLDSNLPDVRISIGTPDDNAFTARVLDADQEHAARFARQLTASGRALDWLPAARTRAQTWVPGADLRGDRDLPVLLVAGPDDAATAAAVADLIADLADATIEVDAPAGDASEALADYSAALLNRGLPGAVIEPDGTLHLSLMRASSGWPSGIWIDPPRRTVPDGSSFSWQHWSHTFEYALAGGTGDWREAGFVQAGQAYNHVLIGHVTGVREGGLPPSASLLEVEPADVVLTALKPRGNPLAAGEPAPDEAAGNERAITLRCYETAGRPVTARVRCFVPLRGGAAANVLEEQAPLPGASGTPGASGVLAASGVPVTSEDGVMVVNLGPAATVTATAVADLSSTRRSAPDSPGSPGATPPPLGPVREAAQPVFARYWLHNKGPAPLGHQPVTVHVQPRVADLSGGTPLTVTVSATSEMSGTAELIAPPGVSVTTPGGLRYHIGPDGYQVFHVLAEPQADAAPGIYHLAVRVPGEHGQAVEDVVTLRAEDAGPDLDVSLETAALTVKPGGSAELRVRLTSQAADEVRGEAQLISPFGTWDLAGPWTRGFTVPPSGATTLGYRVDVPPGARPMSSWLLVKVMAFGTIHYTPAIPLTIAT